MRLSNVALSSNSTRTWQKDIAMLAHFENTLKVYVFIILVYQFRQVEKETKKEQIQ